MADGEGAGKQFLGKRELAEQREFALAEPSSLGALRLEFHLEVIILQEMSQSQPNSELLTYPPQILGNFTYLRTWVRTKTCPLFRTGRMLTAVGIVLCYWLLRDR